MGRIYYMMGKSSSGKDTLFKEVKEALPQLKTVTLYTTRPAREGEIQGREYLFVQDKILDQHERDGKVIELRAYNTVQGVWKYATVDDGRIDLDRNDYLAIGTLESYRKLRDYFGRDKITPLYIEVEDGERLYRALERERCQELPAYDELCRRFLADQEDFSEENLKQAGIEKRFINKDKTECLNNIIEEIQHGKF